MNFTNVKLNDGNYGAWSGSGMKRKDTWYTGSTYAIGTTENDTLNGDYYVIWNEWPVFDDTSTPDQTFTEAAAGTVLKTHLDIDNITVESNLTHSSGTLDCAIVRKSDRKAVRLQVSGATEAHYQEDIIATAVAAGKLTIIDPSDGPWSPEIGRLINMGYV
jgi:hypothetical protein